MAQQSVDVSHLVRALEKHKATIANDLTRYMATVSSRYVAEARKFLNRREGGYKTGELHRSITYQLTGDKFKELISTIGPQAPTSRTQDFNMMIGWWIEKGVWFEGQKTWGDGTGRKFMEGGYKDGQPFAESKWSALVAKWKGDFAR